jgi:hypothetical protein
MATDDKQRPEANRSPAAAGHHLLLILAWSAVGVPLLWGVVQTVEKALPLFR